MTLNPPYTVHQECNLQPHHSPPLLPTSCLIEVQGEGTVKLVKCVREDEGCVIERELKVLNRNENVDGGIPMEVDY